MGLQAVELVDRTCTEVIYVCYIDDGTSDCDATAHVAVHGVRATPTALPWTNACGSLAGGGGSPPSVHRVLTRPRRHASRVQDAASSP